MSTRWGDQDDSGDYGGSPTDAGGDSGPQQRRKLQLKPRSARASQSASSSSSAKSNPFGAAKPREEVLASKGIDAKLVDDRISKKAAVVHFTKEQNMQIEAIQVELTKAEGELREANENELPEEAFRVIVEEKRQKLNELMAEFTQENEQKQKEEEEKLLVAHKHYERPSERRRRLEEENAKQRGSHYSDRGGEQEQGDAYASFGGRHRRDSHQHH